MATHELLHGRNLIVKADGEVLGLSKSCTISVSSSIIPVSGPNTGDWEENIAGRKKWSVQTNHLMYNRGATKPMDTMDMVGQTVELSVDMIYNNTIQFSGFVENVQIESGTIAVDPEWAFVYYDTVNSCFVLHTGGKYYKQWTNADGSRNRFAFDNINDNVFYENIGTGDIVGEYYKADNKNSSTQTYTLTRRDTIRKGNAIVAQWKGTFTVGNLAQGSFDFTGSGPLATLPNSDE